MESDVGHGNGTFFGAMDLYPEVGKTINCMDMDSFTGKMCIRWQIQGRQTLQ